MQVPNFIRTRALQQVDTLARNLLKQSQQQEGGLQSGEEKQASRVLQPITQSSPEGKSELPHVDGKAEVPAVDTGSADGQAVVEVAASGGPSTAASDASQGVPQLFRAAEPPQQETEKGRSESTGVDPSCRLRAAAAQLAAAVEAAVSENDHAQLLLPQLAVWLSHAQLEGPEDCNGVSDLSGGKRGGLKEVSSYAQPSEQHAHDAPVLHAALGRAAAQALHARMVEGALPAERLDGGLCVAVQAALTALSAAGRAAALPEQQSTLPADSLPPAPAPASHNQHPHILLPPPHSSDHASISPFNSLSSPPSLSQQQQQPPLPSSCTHLHTTRSSEMGAGAAGDAAQRTLFWMCTALFELHAEHSRHSTVWQLQTEQGNGCTQFIEQRASLGTRDSGGVTTFMPLLNLLVRYTLARSEYGLLHHLRLTVQHATFASIGLTDL